MKEQTRYRYEKRINELEQRVAVLLDYKNTIWRIFDGIATQVHEGKSLSQGWILHQLKGLLK